MAFISAFQAEDGGSIPPTRSIMKFVFLVQGEGRGHMIQALNLKESLEKKGHTVSKVLVGARTLDSLPSFFREKIGCPLEILTSPRFVLDKDDQGILLYKSAFLSVLEFPSYIKSLFKVKRIIKSEDPGAVISFYEPLASVYFRFFRDKRPVFYIGHQYFMSHPVFSKYFKNLREKLFFRFYNAICSSPGGIKLCLSFTKEDDVVKKNLYVCPPFIKSQIKLMALDEDLSDSDYYLIYILNRGYAKKIIEWNKVNPDIKIETFRNSPEIKEERLNSSLVFHHLCNDLFNYKLKHCRAFINTAGFDSVAEAAYLGKRIMMIPTKNHFEQDYNAIDASRAKIAIKAKELDLSLLTAASDDSFSQLSNYRLWCDKEESRIVDIIEKKCLLQ